MPKSFQPYLAYFCELFCLFVLHLHGFRDLVKGSRKQAGPREGTGAKSDGPAAGLECWLALT